MVLVLNFHRHFPSVLLFAVLLLTPQLLLGQPGDLSSLKKQLRAVSSQNPLEKAEKTGFSEGFSVDPDRYLIGPGDEFEITMADVPSLDYCGTVNQNGEMFIPAVGLVEIGKRVPLSHGIDSISEFIRVRTGSTGEIFVALTRVKSVGVNVSGGAITPGTYQVPGNLRLLDVIKQANGDKLPDFHNVDLRDVHVRNGEVTHRYDLLSFILADSLDQNPYLYPGDNISIRLAAMRVSILGAIRSPIRGVVPIRRGETLAEFLRLFPYDASADTNHILVRKNSGAVKTLTRFGQMSGTVLADKDVIVVCPRPNYAEYHYAWISGEVARPGQYPILKGETTVSELLHLAGGIGHNADSAAIFAIRSDMVVGDGRGQRRGISPDLTGVLGPQGVSIRPGIGASLYRVGVLGDHAVIPVSKEKGDIMVRNGDHIVVPLRRTRIYISGNVASPGSYPYEEGLSPHSYIRQAGGYTSKADRLNVFVIRKFGNKSQLREIETLEAGDIIVVPEREQFRRWTFFKDTVVLLSSIASVVWTIVLVSTSVAK